MIKVPVLLIWLKSLLLLLELVLLREMSRLLWLSFRERLESLLVVLLLLAVDKILFLSPPFDLHSLFQHYYQQQHYHHQHSHLFSLLK
jgi:hypothetical protein